MNNALVEQIQAVLSGPRPLPIVQAGDPALRQIAARFEGLPASLLAELIEAMRVTMHAAPGVGLAAPQVGIGLQLAVIEDPATIPAELAEARDRRPLPFGVIINPRYRPIGDQRATFYEGCLSVSGYQAVVDRPASVRLDYLDEHLQPQVREFSGWQARIVQHETDHLAGALYLDKAITRSLTANEHYQRWAGPSLAPAREQLGF